MALKVLHHALNVGVVDANKLHRVDLTRMRLAAADQTNFLCDAVGRAFGRPGTKYLGATKASNQARLLPFIGGQSAAYLLEMTDAALRVWSGDALVTRAAVATTVTNGDFSSATGWTLAASAGQSSTISGGKLTLKARAHGGKASAKRTVTIAGGDQNVEHAFRIVVDRGPVTFRCGSSDGGDEYIGESELRTGEHSLAFTPTGGTVYIQFTTSAPVDRIVDSIAIEAAGAMELPTPWPAADLRKIQFAQSLDVLFIACAGYQPQRIERRGATSWSVVAYDTPDGPFSSGRSADLKLTPSVLEGNGTLTASEPFFTAAHVGALFRLTHEGQKVDTYLAGDNQFTPAILVTGITETNFEERKFTNAISGTWAGTLRTQRSFEADDNGYTKCRREQAAATIDITANATFTNDDNDDNAITYYRVGFEQGTYTSGEAHVVLTYPGGIGTGICRVTGFTSSTVVDIEVISPFSGTHATEEWQEGEWSDALGWPAGIDFHEGRLWFCGDDRIWGSVSDAYDSFDEDFIGDAGPLVRSIALGGRNEGRWLLSISNLMVGCDSRLAQVRASSLDEILTPENFGVHNVSPIGAATTRPVALADDRALLVGPDTTSIYEATYDSAKARFLATEFSKLTTDLFATGVVEMALQNRPDQRIWILTESADAVCVVFEPQQEVIAFIPISTGDDDDVIESACVLPSTAQDRVYFSVKRVIDGATVRYIEKMALDSEALPATKCMVMDAYVEYGAVADGIMTGLDHLEGETVVAWADGDAVNEAGTTTTKEFVVSGGSVALGAAVASGAVVGKPYRYRYESARLAYGEENATSMLNKKAVAGVGLMLADYCRSGVKMGTNLDPATWPLRSLPTHNAKGTTATEVVSGPDADEEVHPIHGEISFDSRVVIEGASPKPLSILSLVMIVENHGG